MKKVFLSLLLFLSINVAFSQEVIVGDMNDDNVLNISDVSTMISTLLGKTPQRTIMTSNNDIYQIDNSKLIGTWRTIDNSSTLIFNSDGTSFYDNGSYRFKFYPTQGNLLFVNEYDIPVKALDVVYLSKEMLAIKSNNSDDVYVYILSDNTYKMYAKDNESNIITNPINIPASGASMYVNYSWDANNGAVMTGIGELSDTYNIGTPEGLRSYLSIPANYNTESRDITYSVMGKGQSGGEEFITATASNSITFNQAAASYTLKSLKVTKVDDQVISKDNDLKTLTGNSYTVNSSAHEIEITGILENTVGTHFNTVTPTKTTTSTSSTVSVSGDIEEGKNGDDDIRDTFKLNVSIPESTNSGSDTSHEFSLGAGNSDWFKNAITNQIFKFLQKKAAVGSIYIGLLYVGDSETDDITTYIGTPGTNSLLGIGEDTTGTISWEIDMVDYIIPVKYVYQIVDPSTVTFENGISKETWNSLIKKSEIEDWDSDSKEYFNVHNMVLIPGGFNGGAIQYSSLGGSFNMSTKQTLSNGYSICKGTSISAFDIEFSIKLFTN